LARKIEVARQVADCSATHRQVNRLMAP